jgi:uncharacterized ferredoxin-like protein
MDENKPIIRFYFAKMKKAFMDLSEKEKMAFMRKDRENLDELGMKAVIMVNCRGSNEEWDYIGVEEWPTIDAIKEREKFENEELEVHKYAESKTYLGSAESFSAYGKDS